MDDFDKRIYMDDVFFSTSPVEKGIVFGEIAKNIKKIRYDDKIKDLCKKHSQSIDDLHMKYNKKLYNMVMKELIVYKKIRYNSMLWTDLISSI